jgi:hypothetical protein
MYCQVYPDLNITDYIGNYLSKSFFAGKIPYDILTACSVGTTHAFVDLKVSN